MQAAVSYGRLTALPIAMEHDGNQESQLANAALQQVQASSRRIADANKEWYSAMAKYGKAVEKVRDSYWSTSSQMIDNKASLCRNSRKTSHR
jgi:hypothetical protein